MKKSLSFLLSLVIILSCFSMTGITAFASYNIDEAVELNTTDKIQLQTQYDRNRDTSSCWAKFTPEVSGLYVFNAPSTDEDQMFFTTVFKSYEGAKEYNFDDIKNAQGYIYNEEKGYDGEVYQLLGKHTYYIDYEAWDFNNQFAEPVIETTIMLHTHTFKNFKDKSDTYFDGEYGEKCSVCDARKNVKTIPRIDTITLSTKTYTYNGKSKKPTVTVKDRKGNKLVNGTDYSVSFASGRTKVGKYTVKVSFKGNYAGTVTKTFTIKPKSTSISSLTASKKAFTVKWKKQSTQTTGYQVQFSTSSKFNNAQTKTYANTGTTSKKYGNLKGGRKYYVRVRTYKKLTINGKATKIYSSWSKTKTIITKL